MKSSTFKSCHILILTLAIIFLTSFLSMSTYGDQLDESEKILPDEVLSSWTQFKQKNGANWKIEYDSNLGIPTTLDGGQTEADNRIASLHEEISIINIELLKERAKTFFGENEYLLQIKSRELRFLNQRTIRKKKRRLVYYQEYQGIPVILSEVNIDINARGQVIFYRARYFKDIPPLNIVSTIPQEDAEAIVNSKYKNDIQYEGNVTTKSRLVILPNIPDKDFYLTWEVKINSDEKDLPMAYYVEATNGQIIHEHPEFFRSEEKMIKPKRTGSNSSASEATGSLKSIKQQEENLPSGEIMEESSLSIRLDSNNNATPSGQSRSIGNLSSTLEESDSNMPKLQKKAVEMTPKDRSSVSAEEFVRNGSTYHAIPKSITPNTEKFDLSARQGNQVEEEADIESK